LLEPCHTAMLAAEVLFPPAPNWYSAHVADTAADGTLAVATHHSVTLVNAQTRQVAGICNLRGRVAGVACCDAFVFACLVDRTVHALALGSLSALGSHKEHPAEPTAIITTADFCITADKRGTLCLWPLPQDRSGTQPLGRGCLQLVPVREGALCLSAAPSRCGKFAVGYQSGLVGIVDVATRTMAQRLRHQSSVQALSWAGVSGAFLTCACQDQSVQLWRLDPAAPGGAEPPCERIAGASGHYNEADSRPWITVHAVSEETILYSGSRGEFFSWEASKKKSHKASIMHLRPIFCIRSVGDDHVVTAGMDRFIVLWTLGKGAPQMKWRLCCLGGHVTSMRTNGTNMLCVGCGDSNVRVMDLLHREHRQHCWVVWRGLRAPVTSFAHSRAIDLWGFGLQDGGYGVLPISSSEGPGEVELLSAAKQHPGPVTSVCLLHALGFKVVHASEAAVADARAQPDKGQKKGGKKSRPADKKAPQTPSRPSHSGIFLVSLSAGHQVQVASLPSSSSPVPTLTLEPHILPLAMAAWPLAQDAGEALVIAADRQPQAGSSEGPALMLVAFDAEASSLKVVATMSAEGLDAGASCIAVWAVTGGDRRSCRVLCGTAKGSLAVLRLTLPAAAPASADDEASASGSWPLEAACHSAHGKPIVDVQWQDASASGDESRFLSASMDGSLKVWSFAGGAQQLQCLCSIGGSTQHNPGTALLSACWDLSASSSASPAAVLFGGRDQVASRWVPGKASTSIAITSGTDAPARPSTTAAPESLPLPKDSSCGQPAVQAVAAVVRLAEPAKAAGATAQRAGKQRAKPASLLPLASYALHQQSMQARAQVLARLAPRAPELWLRGEAPAGVPSPLGAGAGGPEGSAAAVAEALFANRQDKAELWFDLELRSRLQPPASDERQAAAGAGHKARLLQLWATDVTEAVKMAATDESDVAGVSSSWLWAALRLATGARGDDGVSTLQALAGGAASDSVHHACAAAVALGRIEDAVQLYLRSELFPDALLLARLRLPARHPLVTHIYEQWAKDLKRRGNHDQAAACYLAIGQLSSALASLEELLPATRSALVGAPGVGPDALRPAAAFAAAATAAALAERGAGALAEVLRGGEGGDDEDCFATFAYDHRQWWNRPELRTAAVAWKRCLVEALHAGCAARALNVARVELSGRPPSTCERFLRSTMSGYASAMQWWVQLERFAVELSDESGRIALAEGPVQEDSSGSARTSLSEFVARCMAAVPEEDLDWDFEWRALTWLPGFSSESEDPLLVAAVELGRACVSLASGATRSSADDAPWNHVVNAVVSLLRAGDKPLLAAPLRGFSALCRRVPSAGAATRARGACVAATAALASALAGAEAGGGACALSGAEPWAVVNEVLFGAPCASSGSGASSSSSAAAGFSTLRRGLRFGARAAPEAPRSASWAVAGLAADTNAGEAPSVDLPVACQELEWALHGVSDLFPAPRPRPRVGSENQSSGGAPGASTLSVSLQTIRDVRAKCGSPGPVLMVLAFWCAWLQSKMCEAAPSEQGGDEDGDDEYVVESASEPSLWASYFGSLEGLVAELEAEHEDEEAGDERRCAEVEADAGTSASPRLEEEAAGLDGVLELEARAPLSWSSRLALLQRWLDARAAAAGEGETLEERREGVLCQLLTALSPEAGDAAAQVPSPAPCDILAFRGRISAARPPPRIDAPPPAGPDGEM